MVEQSTAATLTSDGLEELSHETAGSNERAVDLFQRAIASDASFAPAYAGLAKAYVQRTDDLGLGLSSLEPAVAAAKHAIELDPSLGDPYYALGRAYRIQGWLSEERQLWQQRMQVAPDDSVASERLGWVLWFTGHAEEALPRLRAAAAARPNGRWVHFYLGNANLALGDFDEAERMYRGALGIDPQHSSAQAGVIWSLLAARKDDVARTELHNFQDSSYDGDRYPLKLADIEYFSGEIESARVNANEALKEPEERYWPRGFLASTILGAVLWPKDRGQAEEHLGASVRIDRNRLRGGDQGYMAHVDLAAVDAIRGDVGAACRSLREAVAAGWRYGALAARDRLFENIRTESDFLSLVKV